MRTLIASAAMLAALQGAVPSVATAQNFDFCLKSESGLTSCNFQTMAQCLQAKQASDECLSKSETMGTTGSGGMAPPAGRMSPMSPPPASGSPQR